MKVYIELWKAREAWNNLDQKARTEYLEQFGPVLEDYARKGVEIISWGMNDPSTHSRVDFDFFAIWKFPKEDIAKDFEQMVVDAGWYHYFDQVNAMGTQSSPQEIIPRILEL